MGYGGTEANVRRAEGLFLLVLNVFLPLVGCLMDIFSAIVVVVPLLWPIGQVFGSHPLHLGMIFLANLELGYPHPSGRHESLPGLVSLR